MSLAHRRVLPDLVEHLEGTAPVSAPETVGEWLHVRLVAEVVELHQARLAEELVASSPGRLAVPGSHVLLERYPELLDRSGHLLTDVETIGELPAEDGYDATPSSISISCLRESLVQSTSRASLPSVFTTRGRTPHRSAMTSSLVSGLSRSSLALIWPSRKSTSSLGRLRVRIVDPGVRRPDHRATSHRDHVEQTLGVVEEGEHSLALGQLGDDEMYPLRIDDAVLRLHPQLGVEPVDEGPGGVDDHAGIAGEVRRRRRRRRAA